MTHDFYASFSLSSSMLEINTTLGFIYSSIVVTSSLRAASKTISISFISVAASSVMPELSTSGADFGAGHRLSYASFAITAV